MSRRRERKTVSFGRIMMKRVLPQNLDCIFEKRGLTPIASSMIAASCRGARQIAARPLARVSKGVPSAQDKFPVSNIDPPIELKSHLLKMSDFRESEFLVKRNAGVIW